MIKPLLPIEALVAAIEHTFLSSSLRNRNDPGKAIEKLPEEIRESLRKLTSDDALNVRIK